MAGCRAPCTAEERRPADIPPGLPMACAERLPVRGGGSGHPGAQFRSCRGLMTADLRGVVDPNGRWLRPQAQLPGLTGSLYSMLVAGSIGSLDRQVGLDLTATGVPGAVTGGRPVGWSVRTRCAHGEAPADRPRRHLTRFRLETISQEAAPLQPPAQRPRAIPPGRRGCLGLRAIIRPLHHRPPPWRYIAMR
jgi:hypothetical protein